MGQREDRTEGSVLALSLFPFLSVAIGDLRKQIILFSPKGHLLLTHTKKHVTSLIAVFNMKEFLSI